MNGIQEVSGSIPLISTKKHRWFHWNGRCFFLHFGRRQGRVPMLRAAAARCLPIGPFAVSPCGNRRAFPGQISPGAGCLCRAGLQRKAPSVPTGNPHPSGMRRRENGFSGCQTGKRPALRGGVRHGCPGKTTAKKCGGVGRNPEKGRFLYTKQQEMAEITQNLESRTALITPLRGR